jgi:Tol biopolymer transport system component
MKEKKLRYPLMVFMAMGTVFLQTACGGQTAREPTAALTMTSIENPTEMASPIFTHTNTPLPTRTHTNTPIPSATPTSIPSVTPTPTMSSTPTPPELPSTGGLIAYISLGNQYNPTEGIYLVDPQMPSSPILLSSYPTGDIFPAWSPDGQIIAITSMRYADNADIFLLPVDGSEVIRLTDDPAIDAQLDWSPDGQQVAFSSLRDGNQEIYLADRDGSHVERLTNDPGLDVDPVWSPDGNQIAFTSDRSGNMDIFLLDLVGGSLTQLTNNPEDEFRADWSPGGNQIVFTSDRNVSLDLYLMNADGSDMQRLTDHPAEDENPSWSPDGAYIAFDSNRAGNDNYDIFVIELASGETVQLTSDPRDDVLPDWGQTDFDFGTDPWFGYGFCVRDVDNDFSPDEPTEIFYTTDTMKYVAFQFRNMENGMYWEYQSKSSSPLNMVFNTPWDSGTEGFHLFFLQATSAEEGPFTIELYIEDELIREITGRAVAMMDRLVFALRSIKYGTLV